MTKLSYDLGIVDGAFATASSASEKEGKEEEKEEGEEEVGKKLRK